MIAVKDMVEMMEIVGKTDMIEMIEVANMIMTVDDGDDTDDNFDFVCVSLASKIIYKIGSLFNVVFFGS